MRHFPPVITGLGAGFVEKRPPIPLILKENLRPQRRVVTKCVEPDENT